MIRSHLTRHQPCGSADDAHLRDMAMAAWHQRGVLLVAVDDIENDWLRKMLASMGNEQFGKREAST